MSLPAFRLIRWRKNKSQPAGRAMAGVGRILVSKTMMEVRNRRVGKGVGTAVPHRLVSRAPCPRVTHHTRIAQERVGTAHESHCRWGNAVPAPLPTLRNCIETKEYRPLFAIFGPGVRPHSFTSVSLEIEGVGAPTRRSARIAPGGVSGLLRTMRCTCDAPRASRRANKHLRAYALPTTRTGQDLFVPGRLTRVPPVGKVASTSPAGALPLPALRTPPEGAPRTWIGMGAA
jgi:hypothetical protein